MSSLGSQWTTLISALNAHLGLIRYIMQLCTLSLCVRHRYGVKLLWVHAQCPLVVELCRLVAACAGATACAEGPDGPASFHCPVAQVSAGLVPSRCVPCSPTKSDTACTALAAAQACMRGHSNSWFLQHWIHLAAPLVSDTHGHVLVCC